MISRQALQARGLRDRRWRALVLAFVGIAVGGMLIAAVSDGGWSGRRFPAEAALRGGPAQAADSTRQEIHLRFQQGVIMLHAKQYEHAMTSFHRVLELDPAMPEAHVNMGFALIGRERYSAARDFFESAIALRKEQINAYYGLAVALDALHDRPGAIGAMRSFVHLSKLDDPYTRKAKAALRGWEVESKATTSGPSRTR